MPLDLLQAEDVAIKLYRAFEVIDAIPRVQQLSNFHGREDRGWMDDFQMFIAGLERLMS